MDPKVCAPLFKSGQSLVAGRRSTGGCDNTSGTQGLNQFLLQHPPSMRCGTRSRHASLTTVMRLLFSYLARNSLVEPAIFSASRRHFKTSQTCALRNAEVSFSQGVITDRNFVHRISGYQGYQSDVKDISRISRISARYQGY